MKIRYTYIDPTRPGNTFLGETFPLVIKVDDPVGKFVQQYLYPARTVGENQRIFAELLCQVFRPGIDIGRIDLAYFTYAIYLEKNTADQTIAWKLGSEPEQYFSQLSEARTRAECEADLPLHFANDRGARSLMKGAEKSLPQDHYLAAIDFQLDSGPTGYMSVVTVHSDHHRQLSLSFSQVTIIKEISENCRQLEFNLVCGPGGPEWAKKPAIVILGGWADLLGSSVRRFKSSLHPARQRPE